MREDVMSRGGFKVTVGTACRPKSGDAEHVEACEARRSKLLDHDAALRGRLERCRETLGRLLAVEPTVPHDTCSCDWCESHRAARDLLDELEPV